MARPLRIEYPGAYYHVINRGNAGESIFKSNRDHEKFLENLATLARVKTQSAPKDFHLSLPATLFHVLC